MGGSSRSPVSLQRSIYMPMVPAFPMTPQLSSNPMTMSLMSMNTYLDAEFGVARRIPGHSQTTSKRGKGGAGNDATYKHLVTVDDLSGSMMNLKTG